MEKCTGNMLEMCIFYSFDFVQRTELVRCRTLFCLNRFVDMKCEVGFQKRCIFKYEQIRESIHCNFKSKFEPVKHDIMIRLKIVLLQSNLFANFNVKFWVDIDNGSNRITL